MREIIVGNDKVIMDTSILEFGETNLNEFLQKIGVYHAYYAEKHADAIYILGIYEQKYEEIYSRKFKEAKGSAAVPLAESMAKAHPEVAEQGLVVLSAQLNKDLLTGFLKSIDKAFQAAMNYGYNKRKEMDKLDHNIMASPSRFSEDPDEKIASIMAQGD